MNKYFDENQYFLFNPNFKKKKSYDYNLNNSIISPSKKYEEFFSAYWRTYSISNYINENKIDIFHGLSNEIPRSIKKTRAKSVLTIHDLIFIRFPELYKPLDRIIYRKKAEYSCQLADKIIAISNQTKTDLIEFLKVDKKMIDVVYQGCNSIFKEVADSDFKLLLKKKYNLPHNFILNVGTIEKRKNIFSVIKAIHIKNIDFPLVIIGKKTKYALEIEKYISENNLENKIIILENVNLNELAAIYQMASIFIYPSVFEGFGIPIIEALNSGVPVITTLGGCFSEAGGEYSTYINPTDIEEINESILFLLNNNDQKQIIIKKGLEFVKKFDDKIIAQNIMNVYKSII